MQTEVTKLVKRGISINKLLSHSALDLIFSKATNSASLVDLVMQVCLDDFQETAFPASVNTSACGLHLIHIKDPVTITIRAVHGLGRVSFRPNPDSTRRRRVEGRSNPKPTAGKMVGSVFCDG